MKKIKAQVLTVAEFAPFGTFTNLMEPSGSKLSGPYHDFYRDGAKYYSDFRLPIGFSPLVVRAHGLEVTGAEYHNRSCEAMLPVNDDAIVHVCPASGGVYHVEETKVFLVPKGTILSLNPGVWHLTPLPLHEKELHTLIVLPERAYVNDFNYIDLDDENKFVIEL